jgi:predicted SprT family Zn-dependent metalloprotease
MASLKQLCFGFLEPLVKRLEGRKEIVSRKAAAPAPPAVDLRNADDAALQNHARMLLLPLGLHDAAGKLSVVWNARLRSTAGYARWPAWSVELNPRLREFDGQTERTLKHELAHLIAYERAGRRRIEPHGAQWLQACADLGIPDETARHTLPLPRAQQTRRFTYACPVCAKEIGRVRKFGRPTACLTCCRTHNRGRYDQRFRLVLKSPADQTGSPSSSV